MAAAPVIVAVAQARFPRPARRARRPVATSEASGCAGQLGQVQVRASGQLAMVTLCSAPRPRPPPPGPQDHQPRQASSGRAPPAPGNYMRGRVALTGRRGDRSTSAAPELSSHLAHSGRPERGSGRRLAGAKAARPRRVGAIVFGRRAPGARPCVGLAGKPTGRARQVGRARPVRHTRQCRLWPPSRETGWRSARAICQSSWSPRQLVKRSGRRSEWPAGDVSAAGRREPALVATPQPPPSHSRARALIFHPPPRPRMAVATSGNLGEANNRARRFRSPLACGRASAHGRRSAR